MPLVIADRVRETSTTTGIGTLTLAGAASGYRTFASGIGSTNTCYYTIVMGTDWEVGIGTVGTGTLTRDTVLSSSNAGSAVNFGAGTKDVFATYPGGRAVTTSDAQTLTSKTLATPTITGTPLETIFPLQDGASVDVVPSNGSIQTLTLTGTGRTMTWGGATGANWSNGQAVTLMINDGTNGTITTWNVTWVNNGGNDPSLSTSGYTVIVVWKVGGTMYGALVGNA